MDCSSYPHWIGDGYCDGIFDCAETGWDGDDCDPEPGYACTLEDGTEGIYSCDSTCVADTTGDASCDDALDCAGTDWDGGDCTEPEVGAYCEATDWSGSIVEGVVACDGSCSSYITWPGDGWCDSIFDCEGMDWDGGDCESGDVTDPAGPME